jgi:hypothetical protein
MNQSINPAKISGKLLVSLKSELQAEFQSKNHGYVIDQAFWASSWSDMQLQQILYRLIKLIQQGYVKESVWHCWSGERGITSALPSGIEEFGIASNTTTQIHEHTPEELDELRKTMGELTEQIPALFRQAKKTSTSKKSITTATKQPTTDDHHTVLTWNSLYSEGPWFRRTGKSVAKGPYSMVAKHDAPDEEGVANPSKRIHTAYDTPDRLQEVIAEGPDDLKCARCGRISQSRAGFSKHAGVCIGRCQHCLKNNLDCETYLKSDCSHCQELGIRCTFLLEDAVNQRMRAEMKRRICSKCGKLNPSLSRNIAHEDSCTGRCVTCQRDNRPCTKSGNHYSCTSCEQAGIICSLETLGECSRCGGSKGTTKSPRNHEKNCIGRCQECKDNNLICDMHGRRICTHCSSLGRNCIFTLDADDGDLRDTIARRLCGRCSSICITAFYNTKHAQSCRGRCSECSRLDIPCQGDQGSRWGNICMPCRRDGKQCYF